MRNILLTIAYDGTSFSGWQKQPSVRTVQGELERILSLLCRETVKLSGTSRTDAGVHAYGQRANFFVRPPIPVDKIKIAANNLLPGDIRIQAALEMPADFHARFDAKGKKYIYRIENQPEKDVFTQHYCYNIQKGLDLAAMQEACKYFIGAHDFRSFMSAGGQERETTVRTIYSLALTDGMGQAGCAAQAQSAGMTGRTGQKSNTARINHAKWPENKEQADCTAQTVSIGQADRSGQLNGTGQALRHLQIEVRGDGFLYNMVRIMAGTLVDVGLGKLKPEQLADIIEAKDRQKAGHTAPPQGLYLAEVYFEPMTFQAKGTAEGSARKNEYNELQ